MKKLLLTLALCALTATAVTAKITLPKAAEFKLSNGLTVNVIERHQLPLFSVSLTCRAGSIYDPVGQEGLASLSSDMLMRGTKTRTAKQIADEIAFGGGTLGNSCGFSSAGFNGEFLTENGEKGFQILADLLLNSTFTPEEFEKTKTLDLGGLQGRREDPRNVAGDAIWEAVLGTSRYAHFSGGTPAQVQALTRDNVVKFVKEHYTPDNCVLVVCGDITTKAVRSWVDKYFGPWKGKAVPAQAEQTFAPISGREVIIYDKPDASQTQIRIGGNGIPLNHADYPALEVARTVYGGSFASRLGDEIRVKRGLTYGVSYRSSSFKPGGVAFVTTFTKNATVGQVVDLILAEAYRMQTEPLPDSELADGAAFRNGTYPLNYETNDDLADVYANMWLNGLDRSYFEDYQERLKAVTSAQAMDAAKKYFSKDNYRLVLVGKADEVRPQVEKFGPVTVKPFSQE